MVERQSKEKKKGHLAEESAKTRRAREKLKKKLEALDSQITPEALQEKTIEIHRWIERHLSDRTVLKTKEIALFDENQNTATVSKKVSEIAEQLRKEWATTANSKLSLAQPKKILKSLLRSEEASLVE